MEAKIASGFGGSASKATLGCSNAIARTFSILPNFDELLSIILPSCIIRMLSRGLRIMTARFCCNYPILLLGMEMSAPF